MEDQLFEVYIRNADGDTHHTGIRDGIKEWLDADNGYRISLNIEGVVITLRKVQSMSPYPVASIRPDLDNYLEQQTVPANVTVRGL